MKKIIFTLFILIQGGYCFSQVGVNTDNPKALLHVDGASTAATTNPSSGNVSAAQAADDVVITNSGNVGIGTLSPGVKLEVIGSTAGSAIKINDTSQGVNKVLISDANGVGTWGSIIGSWFAVLEGKWAVSYTTTLARRQITGFSNTMISNATQGAVNGTNGTITVPFTGKYRINITGHWGINRIGNNPYLIIPMVYVNGAEAWRPYTIGYSDGWGLSPNFTTILSLSAGNILTIYNDERWGSCANNVDNLTLMVEFLQ